MLETLAVDSLDLQAPGVSQYHIRNFTGLGTPPPRSNRPNRSRRHGTYDLTTFYGPRTLSCDLWVTSDPDIGVNDWESFWTAFDALTAALGYGTPTKQLTFRRMGLSYDEFCYVTVEGAIEPEWPWPRHPLCKFPFEVVAKDPRLYQSTLQTHTSASGGVVNNAGNFNTSPLIRFIGPGTNPSITNSTLSTENIIDITYTMGGGDEIEIDTMARTVKLNGTSTPEILEPDSHFWGLVAGNNTISASGTTSIELEWYNARI